MATQKLSTPIKLALDMNDAHVRVMPCAFLFLFVHPQSYALESDSTLGHGQFGSVSKATDRVTGEVMAVKIMPRENASEAHFLEETKAHREVAEHPNIVGLKVRLFVWHCNMVACFCLHIASSSASW